MRADYHSALFCGMTTTGAGCVSGGVSWMVWLFMSHTVRPFFFVSECLPVFLGFVNCDSVARSTAAHECPCRGGSLYLRFTHRRGTLCGDRLAHVWGEQGRSVPPLFVAGSASVFMVGGA